MGNFNREEKGGFRSGGRDGEHRGFQKKDWSGRDSGNKEPMKHQAICSECGKRCEVPFRPVSGKPVFCNDCFSAKRGGASGDRVPARVHYGSKGGEHNDGLRRELREVNLKLDRLTKMFESFTGAGAKPVLAESEKKEEKKSVDAVLLKKALDKATGKTPAKAKAAKEAKESKPKKSATAKKK